MPRLITKELRENMSSFKTKTIALIASSLIVAVAGLNFATTPAVAKTKKTTGYIVASKKTPNGGPIAAAQPKKAPVKQKNIKN